MWPSFWPAALSGCCPLVWAWPSLAWPLVRRVLRLLLPAFGPWGASSLSWCRLAPFSLVVVGCFALGVLSVCPLVLAALGPPPLAFSPLSCPARCLLSSSSLVRVCVWASSPATPPLSYPVQVPLCELVVAPLRRPARFTLRAISHRRSSPHASSLPVPLCERVEGANSGAGRSKVCVCVCVCVCARRA